MAEVLALIRALTLGKGKRLQEPRFILALLKYYMEGHFSPMTFD
jgi:hypothetical protein